MKPDDSCIIGLEETVIETDEGVTRHSFQSTPSTESTCDEESMEKEPYTAFSMPQQILFLAITAFTAMMSPLTANIYLPSLNQIQRDLSISTEKVNLTVTVYMLMQALSPSFWGTLADSLGRRPILMSTMFVYCGACIGLALTPNYIALICFRMLQAFGSSSVIAVGAGVLSDIADIKRRGSYFGIYSIGQSSGPVFGPVLGGIIADTLGWRWVFWILLIIGAISLASVALILPETLRALVDNGSGYANPTIWQWYARRHGKLDEKRIQEVKARCNKRPPMNFFKPFTYLFQPDVFIIILYNGINYAGLYCYLTSTTKQFSIYFSYLSELEIGLCFLFQGVGVILGSFVRGHILDYDYRKTKEAFKEKHPDQPDTEMPIYMARFKKAWIHILFFHTITFFYGWCFQWGTPLYGILILQFFVGFNYSAISTTTQTILIDLFPGKGASITASNNLIRCLLGAVSALFIDIGIEGLGIGWMFTVVASIMTVSNICIPILLIFGPAWRRRRTERSQRDKT
ncbi:hypothetical protein CU097_013755 [Rhizopus azygosporus]|uniref:Major facilitator superfamily (MFS) profile domain-containing protein n=1 Tax=Rhizopus azygosporus TaxID=86630 RepID=A0A367KGJ4_RHIAZ|nr:hypothetical protein CU097_013755 [Rhizopus azygosporus]